MRVILLRHLLPVHDQNLALYDVSHVSDAYESSKILKLSVGRTHEVLSTDAVATPYRRVTDALPPRYRRVTNALPTRY